MSEEGYNGWSNYPTWAVNLWLSNELPLYDRTQSLVDEMRASSEVCGGQEQRGELWLSAQVALALKEMVAGFPEVGAATGQASLASDLLGHALDEVDWVEIAEAWLEDAEAA